MIIVADSSALISLGICDSLTLLDELFDDVKVPKAVYDEVTCEKKVGFEKLHEYLKDKIIDVSLDEMIISDFTLGIGELHAMSLYKRIKADKLLIDDKRARRIADFNNINTIGSLGILLLAKETGLCSEIRPMLIKIYNSDIFITRKICNYILEKTNEEKMP